MRAVLAAALVFAAVASVPAGAQACSLAMYTAEVVAPAAGGSFVHTTDPVPVHVRFPEPAWLSSVHFGSVQFGIARLNGASPPPPYTTLAPEVGTVVETGQLTYDAAAGTWTANANGSGWAQTPGEYVWQASATLHYAAVPPQRDADADGNLISHSCNGPAFTLVHDGKWVHRFTVLGEPALGRPQVTAKAGKARRGRAKVSGTIAKTFPGKVRLTVACRGKRARTTFVETVDGRWSRTVHAKRGCRIDAAVAARPGWTASAASARVG